MMRTSTPLFRLLLPLIFLLAGVSSVCAQLISTRPPLSAQAQIMLHLDGLENTWWVREARMKAPGKGSASDALTEPKIPSDMQMSLQMKAIQGDIQFELYPGVKDFVRLFGQRKRAAMEAVMGMRETYFPMLEKELSRRRMPDNLKYLSVALSALNTSAIAEDGSTGLWQLPFHAAMRYGLTCTPTVDERRDPVLATRAALAYLQDLHRRYGDWTLAVTAFTCGSAGLQRARNRTDQTTDFEELYPHLPESGRDYLPAFFAATYVMRYHQLFALSELDVAPPKRKDIVQVSETISFAPVAEVLRIPEDQLRAYNPVCRTAVIPFTGKAVTICLPAGLGSRFAELRDSIYAVQARLEKEEIPAEPEKKPEKVDKSPKIKLDEPLPPPANSAPVSYEIKPGDNLGAISRWFQVRLADLKGWNGLQSDNIRAGDKLTVYVPKQEATRLKRLNEMSYEEKEASLESGKIVPESRERPKLTRKYRIYTVKSGDSLWAISQKYPGVSADDIMQFNNISEDIRPGMKLKIPTPAP